MDSFPSSYEHRGFFKEAMVFSLDELMDPNVSNAQSPMNIPDSSPFNFRFSTQNSPNLAKRNACILNENTIKSPEKDFKIKPISDRLKRRALSKKYEKVSNECSVEEFDQSCTRLPNSSHLSDTNLPDQSISIKNSWENDFCIDELFEDENQNTLHHIKSLPKLIRLPLIYELFSLYLNEQDINPVIAKLDDIQEFRVIAEIGKYLELQNKGYAQMSMHEKARMLLRSEPLRKKRRNKVIQSIFTFVHRIIEVSNGVMRYDVVHKTSKYVSFYNEVFGSGPNFNDEINQKWDYRKHLKQFNLSEEFIRKCLEVKKYSDLFFNVLNNSFFTIYNISRIRKLSILLHKMEEIIIKEQDVSEKIREGFKSKRFQIPYHNNELRKYFPFFHCQRYRSNL